MRVCVQVCGSVATPTREMAATVYQRLHSVAVGVGSAAGSAIGSGSASLPGSGTGSGSGIGHAGNTSSSTSSALLSHSQLTRSLERILEEAHFSGELILTNRKLKDFPRTGTKYSLTDTVIAGAYRFCIVYIRKGEQRKGVLQAGFVAPEKIWFSLIPK